jgi:hypothetical protein
MYVPFKGCQAHKPVPSPMASVVVVRFKARVKPMDFGQPEFLQHALAVIWFFTDKLRPSVHGPFCERKRNKEVFRMLNVCFAAALPALVAFRSSGKIAKVG